MDHDFYLDLAENTEQLQTLLRSLLETIKGEGFTDEQAHEIAAHILTTDGS